jgi:hypothetical protein
MRYFTSEADANSAVGRDARIETALSAIGGWDDLDFEEMLDALAEIRHRNPPTPLIELRP